MSFKRFDNEDVVVSAESVTAPAWSGNVVTLSTFDTSSTQKASTSGDYYLDVYDNIDSGSVQFAIAYGDSRGSGSTAFNASVPGYSPSSVVYKQVRTQLLGTEESLFQINGTDAVSIYVLSVERSRYKEKILPSSLTLELNSTNYTDDSTTVATDTFSDTGRVYNIVPGTAGVPTSTSAIGLLYPDAGIIIITGSYTGNSTGTGTSAPSPTNPVDFFNDINSFTLRSEETVTSNYVFVRARNSEFNYSNNPSNITGSGELRHDVMVDSPQAYVSTVGLYNDNNDLLAVAKLSRPLLKDFTKEALLRIKLDY